MKTKELKDQPYLVLVHEKDDLVLMLYSRFRREEIFRSQNFRKLLAVLDGFHHAAPHLSGMPYQEAEPDPEFLKWHQEGARMGRLFAAKHKL